MKIREQHKLLKIVKDNYKQIASDFDLSRRKIIWTETYKLISEIKPGDRVLDLACGNGKLLDVLPSGIEYLGIDNSVELISLAKQRYQGNKFQVGDLLNLKENIKDYDYVFCLAALQHIPSKELRVKVLKNIKKTVKQEGKIIISNWNLWKTKHRKTIIKFALYKLIRRNKLDFGDIIFYWKNNKGENISKRYYHAFTLRDLKRISKLAHLFIIKAYVDKYNYWLVLNK